MRIKCFQKEHAKTHWIMYTKSVTALLKIKKIYVKNSD